MSNKKQANELLSRQSNEEIAFNQMMYLLNRVKTLDEVNAKAIDRAGKTGEAIRELLTAIEIYAKVRAGAPVIRTQI